MKINKKLIPIKAHYFCFLGCVSPVLPFLVVVGVQLGIPVSVTGTLSAVSLLLVVVIKPVIAGFADSFPFLRRGIFLLTLCFMVFPLSSLNFIPAMQKAPEIQGQLVEVPTTSSHVDDPSQPLVTMVQQEGTESRPLLLAQDDGECYLAVAWDCIALCSDPWSCLGTNSSTPHLKITAFTHDQKLQAIEEEEIAPHLHNSGVGPFSSEALWSVSGHGALPGVKGRLYHIEGVEVPMELLMSNVSLECRGGQWKGPSCSGVWTYWYFWMFAALLIVGQIAFNTAISFTDAIIVDTIGKGGDYGIQRAWGTVGWGLMGPLSGLLVDWWSGTSVTKDYAPAFFLCFLLGFSDVIMSAIYIKVPEIKTEHNILKKVWPIVRQPRFYIFCMFVLFNGAFDGVVISYIFIMQEEMAQGTSAMNYMKFLQGLTLFVECAIEAPFMFINKWFLDKFGAHYVTSLVFFLYIFRLLGLALVGFYGPVWATLVVELLNGPCYGLGYIAIVVYSSRLAPPGTTTTVQSIVNIFYESIGYAAASFFGGMLYTAIGGPRLYLVCGITSVIVFILHLISLKVFPPPDETHKEIPVEGAEDGEKEELNKEHGTVEPPDETSELSTKEEGSLEMNNVKV